MGIAVGAGRRAPGWRAEIARIGMKGWSDRLMAMRFAPDAVPAPALACVLQAMNCPGLR